MEYDECIIYTPKLVERTISGAYENDRVTAIGEYAFSNCTALNSVSFPAATSVGKSAFEKCTYLVTINLPMVESISNSAFSECRGLTSIKLPATKTINASAFYNCTALNQVDLPVATQLTYPFTGCNALTALILRNAESVCAWSPYGSGPIQSGVCYIYVPAALVDSYKAATNWSTYADQIRAIEDYPEICGGE